MRQNEIKLIGNVVFDPETITAGNGNSFAKLRMATNTKFKENERTCFVDVKLFGRAYRDFEYFEIEKGDKIIIDGELVQESWEKDNEKRSTYVVYANSAVKVHRKERTESSSF